jgi:hypothetical protein
VARGKGEGHPGKSSEPKVRPLTVIDEPEEGTRSVLMPTDDFGEGPIIRGEGSLSFSCGECGRILLENVRAGQFGEVVVCCPSCASYNDTIHGH